MDPLSLATIDSYQQAVEWLEQHYNLESVLGKPEIVAPSLNRMRVVMELLGHPEIAVPAIHITGTNGKGSTTRMIVEMLTAVGLKAGSYTSPHVTSLNDRIAIANQPLSDQEFCEAIKEIAVIEPWILNKSDSLPNYFEIICAAAYNWFAMNAVDVNVMEVGMGGRWDATNVVSAEVAVITNMGSDHLEIIGPTMADLAREKSGIIEPTSHVVCGTLEHDLLQIVKSVPCRELWIQDIDFAVTNDRLAVGGRMLDVSTPFGSYEEIFIPVNGRHQSNNALLAIAATEAFFARALDADILHDAFASVQLPARFEILSRSPLTIVDGAHNVDGAVALSETLFSDFEAEEAPVLVMGTNRPHNPIDFMKAVNFKEFKAIVATQAKWPRALEASEVASSAQKLGHRSVEFRADVAEAVDLAREIAGPQGSVVVTGSLYVASEARSHLQS
jgi:dihydrofolate synthase/folylpolyglutamate synthase|tara:strand:+ start:1056 stop:2390 length:1335 start_codon:yes stop_codon:yes gene_type:complete